jgi:hypothetical protein
MTDVAPTSAGGNGAERDAGSSAHSRKRPASTVCIEVASYEEGFAWLQTRPDLVFSHCGAEAGGQKYFCAATRTPPEDELPIAPDQLPFT